MPQNSIDYFWKKKTIVSFVLALLVIFIHTSSTSQYILQLPDSSAKDIVILADHLWTDTLPRVAVPLFFVLSGATFFRDYHPGMYRAKLRARVRSLFIPYLIWNTLVMCFYLFCSYTPIHHFFLGRERFLLTPANIINAVLFYQCNYVFWFMYNLIVFVILTPVFDLLTSRKWLAHLFVAASMLLPFWASSVFDAVKLDAGSVVFYAIGCLVGKYYFAEFTSPAPRIAQFFCLALCALCMTLQMLNLYRIVPLPPILRRMLLIVFCIAFWKTMDLIAGRIAPKPYMNYAFFIYAMHPDIQSVFVKLIYLAGPKLLWMVFPNLILSYIATVAVIIAFATVLRKILPKVYSALSGGRG